MTTPNQILVDLLASQSSADSIAGRLRVPVLVIESMLHRHEKDGQVASGKIADTITVWHLTPEGRIAARLLQPEPRKRTKPTAPAIPA